MKSRSVCYIWKVQLFGMIMYIHDKTESSLNLKKIENPEGSRTSLVRSP